MSAEGDPEAAADVLAKSRTITPGRVIVLRRSHRTITSGEVIVLGSQANAATAEVIAL